MLRTTLTCILSLQLIGCSITDGARTLMLIPNPLGAVAHQIEKHRIRGEKESFILFTADLNEKETPAAKSFRNICQTTSLNKSGTIKTTGFRLLQADSLPGSSARGYPTPIDFYSSFTSRKLQANSIVEAIEQAILADRLPVVFEFMGKDGKWKKSTFNLTTETLITTDAAEAIASHGIIFRQIRTGYEDDFKIYGVEISVVDISSQEIVARNIGFMRDQYWGAHNRFRLMPDSSRCGYPHEENFVGSWLSSLAKRPLIGSINPYDGYSVREEISDENRHWADSK